MDVLSLYGIDMDKAKSGKWFRLSQGIDVKLAFAGKENVEFQERAVSILAKAGSMADEEAREKLSTLYSNYILKDWRGLSLGENELSFSKQNSKKILSDPRLDNLLMEIIQVSSNYRNFSIEDKNEKTTPSNKKINLEESNTAKK